MLIALTITAIYLFIGFAFWLISKIVKFAFDISMVAGVLSAFGVRTPEQTTGEKWAEFFLIVFLWVPYGIYCAFKK